MAPLAFESPLPRLTGVLAAALLLVAACAPAAPSPTVPPPKPAATLAPAEQPATAAAAKGEAAPKPVAKPATPAEIALYRGPDRQQLLEEGARKEGNLLWYTTYIVDQLVRPILDGFKKKYPEIQVEFFRANTPELVQRMFNEYKAGRYDVDVLNGINTVQIVKQAGLALPFSSPGVERYTPDLKDREGMWAATVQYFNVTAYNTRLVPAGEAPRTYEDLLDPRWKGKLIWSTSIGSGAPVFVGHILQTMGKEKGTDYLKKLAQVGVRNSEASARAILDQVIGGEFGVSLQAFLHHALISAKQGAPVAWVEQEPVLGTFDSMGLARNPPHPHAAMLFLDYIFSEEGQKLMAAADYAPGRPDVQARDMQLKPPARGVKTSFMNPEDMVREQDNWQKLFEQLFVK